MAAVPRLVIHLGDDDQVVDVGEGTVVLGRGETAQIRLGEPQVSSRHAELRWDGARLHLRDLDSLNGTRLNGEPVRGWMEVRDGDQVTFGPVAAEVRLPPPEPPHPATPVAAGVLAAPAAARVDPHRRPAGGGRRVFVSHASQDKRRARSLARDLRRLGWQPWIDESDIQGGSSWAASIQRAIASSSVVVLLVSADSVAREWVLDEITAARNLRIPVVPAVLEDVRWPEELQFLLQRTQRVDVTALFGVDEDQMAHQGAVSRLDDALLGVMERAGRTNPDRVRMRIGTVLQWVGVVIVLGSFAGFGVGVFRAADQMSTEAPVEIFVSFGAFILGAILGASGAAMERSGRAKGL